MADEGKDEDYKKYRNADSPSYPMIQLEGSKVCFSNSRYGMEVYDTITGESFLAKIGTEVCRFAKLREGLASVHHERINIWDYGSNEKFSEPTRRIPDQRIVSNNMQYFGSFFNEDLDEVLVSVSGEGNIEIYSLKEGEEEMRKVRTKRWHLGLWSKGRLHSPKFLFRTTDALIMQFKAPLDISEVFSLDLATLIRNYLNPSFDGAISPVV